MIQKTKNQIKAIDLMILDLQTIHSDIRVQAKETNCEDELMEYKNALIQKLTSERNNLASDYDVN